MSGITTAGFERKTRTEITADITAAMKAQFGADVDLSPESPIGSLISVMIDQLVDRWEDLEDAYFALYPDTAEGVNLERVVALAGLSRKPALKSIVDLQIFGTAGTVVTNGFQAQTATGTGFETIETATIAAIAGYQEISSTPLPFSGSTVPAITANTYDLDATIDGGGLNQLSFAIAVTDTWDTIVTAIQTALQTATGSTETVVIIGGDIRVTSATTGAASSVLIAAGTAGSGGGDVIAAITTQVANMTASIESAVAGSDGRADVSARALVAGVAGNVGAATITTIGTPVAGVTSVNNLAEATGGAAIETDAALRLRFQEGTSGGSSAQSIQSELNALTNVITATVYENNTDAVDGFGLPAHSIHAVVDGGTDAEIGDILLNFKAAGIETFGNSTTTVVDNAGVSRTFKFDRPTFVDVYVDVDITSNAAWSSSFIATVEARVAEVVGGTVNGVTYDGNGIGADVFSWQIEANMQDILGIDELSTNVETVSPPTLRTVAITRTQRARTDDTTPFIVVTVT